ncbi:FKBP-type peptidyl-prolyl cis-trans isomerase [Bernardetia litoralis DSM 6794]|uniref:Peptidyl-prolyl cis-trans isomerase n=1 Tax=Bernardetia litoralis (strain ATCC 23117 / DSM 6794 / NBRC 15988 / NCIMB 1366 / Fx l1 / Sio-4) TaxID=880071 RepID=I4AQV1_BERLS|nr:peptidylprolyl isomerase [Bernardetia litoralis]AFM06336.1 FKBP-type peptidyl-prolyl cis-trans isomerase [Bernardetia litoralis DSM 6794]
MSNSAKKDDLVQVHYTGKFEDGNVFDSSRERKEPIEFQVGAGQMIKGFDAAVEGMNVGESKTITLAPTEAYGESNPENIVSFPKDKLPPEMNPKVGDQLALQGQNGEQIPVVVLEANEEGVVLDANHPMAGKTLVFDLELVGIKEN